MRELHVVALSEDGQYVLLAPGRGSTRGSFRVAVDSRLAAAVRGDLPRPGESTPPTSDLTPKDIQARLRAGESPEQIAASAGVPVSRVDRFSGPVLSEREKIIERARAAVLTRGRRGDSAVSLAEAVDRHLASAGTARAEAMEWSARRLEGGVWLVEMRCATRGRPRHGAWRYDPTARTLTAADPTSAALGFVEPPARAQVKAPTGATGSRRARSSAVAPGRTIVAMPAARPRRASASPATATSGGRPAAPSAALSSAAKAPAAAKSPVRRTAAEPPPAKASPAKASVAKASAAKGPAAKASPAKAPAAKASPAKPSLAKASAAKAPAAKAPPAPPDVTTPPPAERPAVPTASPDGPPQLRVVPTPAQEWPAPPDLPAAAAARTPKAPSRRAAVPGWADVLLSTSAARPDEAPEDRKD